MEKIQVQKVVKIGYTENYGGQGYYAWLIEEFYDGAKHGSGHKVAYREDFDRLSEVVQDYFKKGFKVEFYRDED